MARKARLALVGFAAVTGTAVIVAVTRDGEKGAASATTAPTATATVTRQDLIVTEAYEATLDYAETRPVVNRLTGTVTWTSDVGVVVEQGHSFYSVDGVPVVLMIGEVPAYRELSADSDDGADVLQLEQNLVALGYATPEDLTVDEEFDADTEAAVEAWEESLAIEADGIVQLGQVVFQPGPVRIDDVGVDVGANASDGADVVSVTSTTKVITLALDVSAAGDVAAGDVVAVDLPDGAGTTATVFAITPTDPDDSDDAAAAAGTGAESGDTETVDVTLVPEDPAGVAAWESATVDIEIVSDEALGVLAVPVTALVALAEGGYAVQVVDSTAASGFRYVAVDPGLYTDDLVEITGAGLDVGTEVVVPG